MAAEKAMLDWMQTHTPVILKQYSKEALRNRKIEFVRQHPHLMHKLSQLRLQFLEALMTECGYTHSSKLARDCFNVFYNARQQVQLFDGVMESLAKLQSEYRLIAITNGNADLASIGLDRYFEHCFSAEDFDAAKPAPDMFDTALAHTGLSSHQCLHVGDHPTQDMLGAHSAGWHTCWLQDGSRVWDQSFSPTLTVQSIQQLC